MVELDQSMETSNEGIEYRPPGSDVQCETCVYRRPVPGNAHIECVFNWTRALTEKKVTMIPLGHTHGIKQGWYMFPILFDPVWTVIKCQAFSKVIDENSVLKGVDKIVHQMVVLKYILDHPLVVTFTGSPKKEQPGGKEDEIKSDRKSTETEDKGARTGEERDPCPSSKEADQDKR